MTCCPCACPVGKALVLSVVLGAAAFVASGFVSHDDKPAPKPVKSQPYPLATCIVSGEKLGGMGKPVVKTFDDREIRFCCGDCVKKFEGDKATYMKKLDEQIVAQQLPHYPLTHCVVMEDDELDVADKTVNYVYANRLVRFCCKDCIKDFNADPAKFFAKLDEAVIKQQQAKYPLTACPISGEKLGGMGEPVTKVYGVTMVKFCCNGCVKKFETDYAANMAKIADAWASAQTGGDKSKGTTDGHEGHDH